jgi:hypothetical protein
MRALTADDVIRVWESSHRQNAAERALTVLSAALPEADRHQLERLSLGRRNALLLAVREQLFGSELRAFSECPGCGERLEFTLDSPAIRRAGPERPAETEFEFESEGYRVRFRLLDSLDLSAAAAAGDGESARRILIERCVMDARLGGAVIRPDELNETAVAQLARYLAERDPQAETLIDLACPACGLQSSIPLDIVSFCNTEIGALARRLLREVHVIAGAYGWRESDILAMSARRRGFYLEMLGR